MKGSDISVTTVLIHENNSILQVGNRRSVSGRPMPNQSYNVYWLTNIRQSLLSTHNISLNLHSHFIKATNKLMVTPPPQQEH